MNIMLITNKAGFLRLFFDTDTVLYINDLYHLPTLSTKKATQQTTQNRHR